MHLHNMNALDKAEAAASRVGDPEKQGATAVSQFGFHVPTYCGRIPMQNTWHTDWLEFFVRDKLQPQISLIEREYGDREVTELWPRLQRRLPELFRGVSVRPALLHGDLWSGNAAETDQGPVLFDPACFYGDAEFDLAYATMYGRFGKDFFHAYCARMPRQDDLKDRQDIYLLYNNINHWNHFGTKYRDSSLTLMRSLLKDV